MSLMKAGRKYELDELPQFGHSSTELGNPQASRYCGKAL
jgi:hypothetical protein